MCPCVSVCLNHLTPLVLSPGSLKRLLVQTSQAVLLNFGLLFDLKLPSFPYTFLSFFIVFPNYSTVASGFIPYFPDKMGNAQVPPYLPSA